MARDEAVDASEESMYALDRIVIPFHVTLWRRGKQNEETRGVGTEAVDDVIRGNNVPLALRHRRAHVGDHPLREETLNGLFHFHQAEVAHHLGPEAGINKVEDGVGDAADVLVYLEPIRDGLGV